MPHGGARRRTEDFDAGTAETPPPPPPPPRPQPRRGGHGSVERETSGSGIVGSVAGGLWNAGGAVVDKTLGALSSPAMDSVIDSSFARVRGVGRGAQHFGSGVQSVANAMDRGGNWVKSKAEDAGAPGWLAQGMNLGTGGISEWALESVADASKDLGNLGVNSNEIVKGALQGADWVHENPGEAAEGARRAGAWARDNPDEIGKFAAGMAWDAATDPVNLAMTVGTGGAATAATAVGRSAGRTLGREAGEALVREGAEAVAREGAEAVAREGGEAVGRSTASMFSGRNTPTGVDRALEATTAGGLNNTLRRGNPLSPGVVGRARNSAAERIATGADGGLRGPVAQRAANAVASGTTPRYGGEVAQRAARYQTALRPVVGTPGTRAAIHAAAYPGEYLQGKAEDVVDWAQAHPEVGNGLPAAGADWLEQHPSVLESLGSEDGGSIRDRLESSAKGALAAGALSTAATAGVAAIALPGAAGIASEAITPSTQATPATELAPKTSSSNDSTSSDSSATSRSQVGRVYSPPPSMSMSYQGTSRLAGGSPGEKSPASSMKLSTVESPVDTDRQLSTSKALDYDVYDPYLSGKQGESDDEEDPFAIRDPYKPLAQPKGVQ